MRAFNGFVIRRLSRNPSELRIPIVSFHYAKYPLIYSSAIGRGVNISTALLRGSSLNQATFRIFYFTVSPRVPRIRLRSIGSGIKRDRAKFERSGPLAFRNKTSSRGIITTRGTRFSSRGNRSGAGSTVLHFARVRLLFFSKSFSISPLVWQLSTPGGAEGASESDVTAPLEGFVHITRVDTVPLGPEENFFRHLSSTSTLRR